MRRFSFILFVAIAVSAFAVDGWSQNIKVLDPFVIQHAQVLRAAPLLSSLPPVPSLTDEQRKHLSGDATNFFYGSWRQNTDEARVAAEALQAAREGGASAPLAPHNTGGILKTLPTVNNRALDFLTVIDTESETTVATAGGVTLVGFNSSAEFIRSGSFSGWSRSTDGGKTFTEIGAVPSFTAGTCGSGSDTIEPAGDPVIVADSSGNFYYSTLAEGSSGASLILIYKSIDGGFSFGLLAGVETCGGFLDKPFLAIDPVNGLLYSTFTDFNSSNSPILEVTYNLAGSALPISTLTSPTDQAQGSFPAIDASGNVYVIWEQFNTANPSGTAIFMAASTNHGSTFGVPFHVVDTNPPLDALSSILCGRPALRGGVRSAVLPSMAIDVASKAAGNIYVVWNDMPGALTTSQVMMVKSTNAGGTWSAPVQVNKSTAGDHFQPGVAVAPNGKIGIFYYDRTGDQNNWHVNTALATSTNGGSSFAVTPVMADNFPIVINADLEIAACYMGDYNQPINNGKNFLMAWGDNSNGDPDVFFAKK